MITEKEKSILLSALNAYWFDHKMKLTSNTLGDIERKITGEIANESKRLIDEFEQKLNIHVVSGKRPFECPNCHATLQEVEMTNSEILDALKAACVSGGEAQSQSDGFYCADWNRCGAICDEQCPACKKADRAELL